MKRKAGMVVWVILVSLLFALGGCGGGGGGSSTGGGGTDTTAPSAPTALISAAASSSSISLNWTASTDDTGVSGYKIYRGGTQISTSATNSFSDSGLTASTDYSYTVAAYDAAGNTSTQSTSASATTAAAVAASGSLDATFGTGGMVTTDFVGSWDDARALGIQSDGKIVAAGYATIDINYYGAMNYGFALARYNTDGTLDTTFGTGGKVTTDFHSDENDVATALGIQSDGKIVVAGTADIFHSSGTDNDFALVRYNTDGSLDTSFGTGGKVTTDIGQSDGGDVAYALSIQSDGKIVVAGTFNFSRAIALVRYNTDGSLDTSFGTGGKVATDIASSGEDVARALGIQSDGKIVAAGYSYNGSNNDFALVRYNTDGSLDATFGTDGKVTTDIGGSWDYAYALSIQSDGKIVAGGSDLVRYNTDGSLDTTFGTGGKATTDIGASALAIQSDGKIVTSGNYVVRYNTDGSLDSTFGTGGVGTSGGVALSIQSDGKFVTVGVSDDDFAVFRYLP